MKWEYIGTGLALVGIGVTLMVALPPPWWPKMPPSAVHIGVLSGLILTLIGAGIIVIGAAPNLPLPKIGPFLLAAAGIMLFIVGATWYVFTPEEAPIPSKPAPTIEALPPSNINLVIECSGSGIPSIIPPNWEVHIIQLTNKGEFQSTGYLGMTPLQAGVFPPNKAIYFGYRCQITNYGSAPLFRIRMSIPIQLFDIIPDPADENKKTSAKEPRVSGNLPLLIQKIDAGPAHAFAFFVFNLTPMFGLASLPSSVMADLLGQPDQSFPLAQPTLAGMPLPLSFPPLGDK